MKNVKKHLFAIALLVMVYGYTWAQKPHVRYITKTSSTVHEEIELQGSGFHEDKEKIKVNFGVARGEILTSTESKIKVRVPSGATYDNIYVTNLESNLSGSANEFFLLSFGGREFEPSKLENQEIYPGAPSSAGMLDFCLCDLDNDQKVDWVAGNDYGSGVYVMQNLTSAGEDISSSFKVINLFTAVTYITCRDLNNDGKPDIVATRGGQVSDRIFVLTNTSSGPGDISFSSPLSLQVNEAINLGKVLISDLDNDGRPEIIVSDQTNQDAVNINNVVHIFQNKTSGVQMQFETKPHTLRIEDDPDVAGDEAFIDGVYGLEVKDLNNDDYPEIMVSPLFGANVCIFTNSSIPGKLSFPQRTIVRVPSPINEIKVAELNGDKMPDIVITKVDNTAKQVTLLINETSSEALKFSDPVNIPVSRRPWSLDFGDLNGDGKIDMAYSSIDDNYGFGVLINKGEDGKTFTEHVLNSRAKQRPVRIGDVDGDGRPDFSFGMADNLVGVYINKNCVFAETRPTGNVQICSGNPVRIETRQGIGLTYDWTLDGGEMPDESLPALETATAGTYQVTISSDDGECVSVSEEIHVTVNPGLTPGTPDITASGPACLGETLALTAESSGGNDIQLHWEGPNGWTSEENSPQIDDVTESHAGYYTVYAENESGCTSHKDTVFIDVLSLPKVTIVGPEAICNGTEAELSTAFYDGHSYQWKKDNTEMNGQNSASIVVEEVGVYSVALSKEGCSLESPQFNLESIALPQADFEVAAKACTNEPVALTDASSIPLAKKLNYSWTFGDGTTSSAKNPSHTYEEQGKYTIVLKVAYENTTCETQKQRQITIEHAEPVTLNSSDEIICAGDSSLLETEGGYSGYEWSTGETNPSIYAKEAGTYSLTATTETGCKTMGSITVDGYPKQSLTIATETGEDQMSIGKSLQLIADDHFVDYSWEPVAGLSDPDIYNPVASPRQTTTYTLTVSDENGCKITQSFTLTIEAGDIRVKTSKAFSPNGDFVNDYWEIEDIDSFSESELAIFDGQGRKVFEAYPYQNDWDARLNGEELPEGVYYYVLKFKETNSVQTGSILVVR